MSGFVTRERRPFVIDTESAFIRPHRKHTALKKSKTPAKRQNGIIHIGHGNQSLSGSQVLASPELKHAWPWSDTEETKSKNQIDDEEAKLFWAINATQNQTKLPVNSMALTASPKSYQKQQPHHKAKDVVVMRRDTSYEAHNRVPLISLNESSEASTNMINSAKVNSVVQSASKETYESSVANKDGTTKTGTQLSSSASTLQVFETMHSGKLSNFLCELYAHDQLTDITVHVGNYGFNAHKVVLACFSPYFANILLNSDNLNKYVLAKNVTPTGFKKILDYMYTKELTIEVENLAEILQAADVLQITDLQDQCYAIFKTAKTTALLDILETSHKQGVRYICEDIILTKLSKMFSEVLKLNELMELCCQCFCLFLSRDDLVVESEYSVALTAVKWVTYSSEERLKVMEQLFAFVRFENMTSNELIQLGQKAKFLMDNKVIAEQVLKVHWSRRSMELGLIDSFNMETQGSRNYKLKKDKPKEHLNKEEKEKGEKASKIEKASANNNNSKHSRKTSAYIQGKLEEHFNDWHALMCFPCNEESTSRQTKETQSCGPVRVFAFPKKLFTTLTTSHNIAEHIFSVETCMRNQKIITLGDSAYLIGGTQGSGMPSATVQPTNKVIKMNLETFDCCEWFPMWEPRYLHSVVSVDNVIYAFGGVTLDDVCLASVEALEHGHAKYGWKRECNMPSSRCGFAISSLDRKIYIAGGSHNPKQFDHILDSVLEYNTEVKQWSEVQCLRFPRFGATMVSDNGLLYIIGGITSESDLNTVTGDVDVWDRCRWMKRARLQTPRFGSSAFVHDSRIIILGGHSDMKTIHDTVNESEVFNINRKIWEAAPSLAETTSDDLHIII